MQYSLLQLNILTREPSVIITNNFKHYVDYLLDKNFERDFSGLYLLPFACSTLCSVRREEAHPDLQLKTYDFSIRYSACLCMWRDKAILRA